MGYSVAFMPKSKKAQTKIVAFLRKHLRPWSVVAEGTSVAIDHDYDATRFIREGDELAYDHGQKVGFNYSTSHLIDAYMWGVLRWAALRVGKRRVFTNYQTLISVPYVVYDGHEAVPVLLDAEWGMTDNPKLKQLVVDSDGYQRTPSLLERHAYLGLTQEELTSFEKLLIKEHQLTDSLVKTELARLSAIWKQEN